MATEKWALRVTFSTEMLGTVPRSKEAYEEFLIKRALAAAKALPDGQKLAELKAEELALVLDAKEGEEPGWTQFRLEQNASGCVVAGAKNPESMGGLVLADYMVRGFFKSTLGALNKLPDIGEIGKIKAYKKAIDLGLFAFPRFPRLMRDGKWLAQPDGINERPIRVETMKGPRVALIRSDFVSAGTYMDCEVHALNPNVFSKDVLCQMLDYGQYSGFGQFRNGSFGRFTYMLTATK